MESELKKRKINPPPRRFISTSTTPAKEASTKVSESSMAAGNPLSIQQARNHAVAQAQQEGCTANFRIFDSPFGNFLIPAIPTRAELSGEDKTFPYKEMANSIATTAKFTIHWGLVGCGYIVD